MKTQLIPWGGETRREPGQPQPRRRRSERGMATVLFIALLSIMLIFVMAESRALYHLHREVKFLEQKQIKRLNALPATPPATNAVAAITGGSQ